MKVFRIITLNFVFVAFALLHVFLQTEITKLGYRVKQNEDKCQGVIDNNRVLKYNIYALESPNTLDKYVLLNNSKLKTLRPVQVLGLHPQSEPAYSAKKESNNLLAKNSLFLGLKRFISARQVKAEARQ